MEMTKKQNIKYVSIGMYKQLEEENKTLKDNVEFLHSCLDDRDKSIAIMQEEIEKLEEEKVDLVSFNENYSPDVIVKYVDRYETLYNEVDIECAKLSDENKRLNIKVASLEGEIKGLNYTIEELHKELSECECSLGFESDEVGFWKGEYKRLKKWIKDHCKGYGNLFPEDEMKRQWKKADKKRK